MPNWTENSLRVYAKSKEELEAFITEMKTKESDFDFNAVVPMPGVLRNSSYGSNIFNGQKYQAWYEKDGDTRPFNLEEQAELVKIGFSNWYEWAASNWGCKWSASSIDIDTFEDEAFIKFQTPWGPPEAFFKALVEKYPNLGFTLRYRNEDDEYYPHEL